MFEDMMNRRETRLMSPAFQAEMVREKQELADILKDLGGKTVDAGLVGIARVPIQIFLSSIQTILSKKYRDKGLEKDAKDLFFGPDGVVVHTGKVVKTALHATGKSLKIGIRYLIAK